MSSLIVRTILASLLFPTYLYAELLFRPSIDGFKGEWELTWNDSHIDSLFSSYAELRTLTFRFRGARSFEIVDSFGVVRLRGITAKRKNKLKLSGGYRIVQSNSEIDLILEEVFQKRSGRKDLELKMDKDSNLRVLGSIGGVSDIYDFTLTRIEVAGKSTSLIKNIRVLPKKTVAGGAVAVKIQLRNLGPVSMGWGLAFDVIFPVDIPVEDIIGSSNDYVNIERCSHGPPFARLDTLSCLTENLGPKKTNATLVFTFKVPESYTNKKFRLKVKSYSPNAFQKVKKDSFRKNIKIKKSQESSCRVNPKSSFGICDLSGGSGLGFSIGCGAIDEADRRFVVSYHGKVRSPNNDGTRVGKYTLLCARSSTLCESLGTFGAEGYVASSSVVSDACSALSQRCSNVSDIPACG